MNVTIGTGNNLKVTALRETLLTYDDLANATVVSLPVFSGVAEQPIP